MLKNLLIFRVASSWVADLAKACEALEAHPFTPCAPTQERSMGWVSPRGKEHGAIIENIGGHWITRFVVETKVLPGSVVDAAVEAKCKEIEQQTGRKPGRKEMRDIKDDARLSLLPAAFTKKVGYWVWLDVKQGFLVIDASSPAKADEILTALVEQLPGFVPKILQTVVSPATAMTAWLEDQVAPGAFSLGAECELKAADDTKATVKYARHSLEIEEVRGHLQAGKRPTRLSLGYADRAAFVLTDTLQVKKLHFSDVVHQDKDKADDHFDADVALTTGELAIMIPALIEALGGEETPL
ncbi:recombination-associated protein RdgC [Lampropedia aestuarii]|uniref:Recombination-associated protein RdgC n=1 Tax=Lampropedia aestuarii TaxID=2562762 RepID=A0A4S5BRA7_9BURK|nr:recombination-associated protein RdgC [Lampropedia aestuarii]THJ32378.1 recombination-associated protein RdgC [Lampropedia aestuarii]